jgi:hypothetical protein
MTAIVFLGYTLAVAGGAIAAGFRWLPSRAAIWMAIGLAAWLGWAGFLSGSGMLADTSLRPPAMLYMAGPLIVFGLLLAATPFGARAALAFPLPLLLGAQTFRVGVEWLLHRLWLEGVVPRMLTWEGANLDILIGLTAPFAAWTATRGRGGAWFALAWSVAGLAMLANVVVRAVLTAPGGLNLIVTEVPNRLPGLFPYSYLAGFLAPLALVLHILAIRSLRRRLVPSISKTAG